MKKFLLAIMLYAAIALPISSFAQTPNDFEIIPKSTDQGAVDAAVIDVGAE